MSNNYEFFIAGRARNRENIVQTIEGNFDNWFVKGVRIEELENDIKSKKEETDKLIDGFEQVNVNKDVKDGIDVSFEAMSDLYVSNVQLEEFVLDMYTMIQGGVL